MNPFERELWMRIASMVIGTSAESKFDRNIIIQAFELASNAVICARKAHDIFDQEVATMTLEAIGKRDLRDYERMRDHSTYMTEPRTCKDHVCSDCESSDCSLKDSDNYELSPCSSCKHDTSAVLSTIGDGEPPRCNFTLKRR